MTAKLSRLLRLAQAPRSRIWLSAGLGALTIVFGAGLMATAGYLITRAAERPAVLSLMVTIVAVRVFGLGRPVLRYFDRLSSHDLALRLLGGVRTRFYARIEPLAPAQLQSYRSGDLLSRMVADVDALQNLYLKGIGPPLVALLAGAVCVGAEAAFLPGAALVLGLGLLASGVAIPALSGALARRVGRPQAAARGELTAEVIELVIGAGELVVFAGAQTGLERVRRMDRRLVGLARGDAAVAGLGDGLAVAVTGLTVAGVLAVAVTAAGHGQLDRVLIALLALLALAAFEAVTPLAGAAREFSATLAAGRRVLELIDRPAAVADPATPVPFPTGRFEISLEGVRARYPGQPHPALDGLSLRLAPGERVALVGASGAGKTTLTNLLLRFLDPEAGRVRLGGRDLREYRLADVRGAIAVAGQESHLFSTTIRENVRLARPEAGDFEIERALRRARVWDWVAQLPDGLDTPVGEEGRELSGGQRQRIVLARALLVDAPVLVLDEPTAHLDPATATELMRDVFAATPDQTLLLITHRSEGLDLVDRVVALELGRLAMSASAYRRAAAVQVAGQYRYGVVLVLILILVFFQISAPAARWAFAIDVALAGGALTVAVATSRARGSVRRRRARTVAAVGFLVFLGIVVGVIDAAATFIILTLIVAAIPVTLAGGLVRLIKEEGVTVQVVAGALAMYLLVGLLFASIIAFVSHVENGAYFVQGNETDAIDLYYSFTVLTTTGFGDYTSRTPFGHGLAVLEMLTGQLYLVTVIGIAVGNFAGRRMRSAENDPGS